MPRTKSMIRKIGNSAGVVLHKEVLAQSGLRPGDSVSVTVTESGVIEVSKSDDKRNRVRRIVDHNHKRYANTMRALAK
ncbi:MAG TPA: AbrB/MazE/SpoVT family DNA-binding domain-containing protein [Kiloniellaceae bacterium]|nr:AbrB/MazE/SpoVT family DNA-binding domain-containing protein [Kiloniellaceae bacterium]